MKLEQSFEVAAPLERVWEALIDVERVAPCLPGASVTGHNDDGSYTGEFKVKIGPTSAAYSGKLNMEDVDAEAHRATMQAAGTDKRGQGGAKATIISSVAAAGSGQTTVSVDTDYHITGRLARFGRGGMIEEISNRLLGEFAKNLQTMLAAGEDAAAAQDVPAPEAAPDTASLAETVAADPDAAIEGAMPVADNLVDQVGDRQVGDRDPQASHSDRDPQASDSDLQAAPAAAQAPPPPPTAPESEPISAGSLVGSVAWGRVKSNPAPLAALVVGFLVALRVLRRRG